MRKFTPEQELEAIEMYRTGSSTNDVAARYNVSRTAIKMLLRRHGVPIRSQGRHSMEPREIVEEQIVKLRLEGVRVRDIASRLRVADKTVSKVLIERGLHTRLKRGENSTARRRFTPEQDRELAQEYLAGATIAKLAEKHRCNLLTVRDAILRAGGTMRRKGGVIAPFSRDPAFPAQGKAMWDRGMTQAAIGEALECSQGLVSRVLVRHGAWKGAKP